jgi:hypothetical protein
VIVLDYSNFDGNLQLQIDGGQHVIGPAVTRQVFVEIL